MGVGTILDARKIVLMAFGEHKAPIVQKAVEGPITEAVAASFLQQHPDATFMLDQAAAGDLTAVAPAVERRAGQLDARPDPQGRHLAEPDRSSKGLLKLSDDDFREHELYELLREHGPAKRLGRRVFDEMMATICTAPGRRRRRKPSSSSARTPTTTSSAWAARIIRLVEQGHKVHVAYMTSGNIAVFDHDAWRFTDFVVEFNRLLRHRRGADASASRSGCRVSCAPRSRASPTRTTCSRSRR